ncbi:hypothetical protein RB195_016994 [Necator americanus]|uniref:ascorbate ferrireductase (transmembrane) n=1 Tax=Necator americanus TaxID=51031 RepID=A0ABR1C5A6_NECAM
MLISSIRTTLVLISNIAFLVLAGFDASTCGNAKGCYIPEPGLAFSYHVVPDSYIDVELSADVKKSNHFVAVTFDSGLENMPNIVCSSIDDLLPTIAVRRNEEEFSESDSSEQFVTNATTSFQNGTLYCRARLLINGKNDSSLLTYQPSSQYTITITEGPIGREGHVVSKSFTSAPLTLDAPIVSPLKYQYSLDVGTRRKLVKAHAILMVLAWFFFIPTAFVFARFLKDTWSGVKFCGVSIWYQVHRVSNFIGIILMIASFVCILTCKDWRWTGPGSSSQYHTQTHTMTGLLALIFAWLQPIGSLFRCPPRHHLRPLFNWGHRLCGVVAFALATSATAITALEFKIWQERELQMVLVLAPSVILIVLILLFILMDNVEDAEKEDNDSVPLNQKMCPNEKLQNVRVSLVFFALGLLMTVSIWMTVLLANGYKNAN